MENSKQFYSRDITILQQSQSKLVLEFLTHHGIIPTTKELFHVTQLFVECCMYLPDDELKNKIDKLDKWIIKKKNPDVKTPGV